MSLLCFAIVPSMLFIFCFLNFVITATVFDFKMLTLGILKLLNDALNKNTLKPHAQPRCSNLQCWHNSLISIGDNLALVLSSDDETNSNTHWFLSLFFFIDPPFLSHSCLEQRQDGKKEKQESR
ncbi:hypothetical protein JHK87_026491 [Glycine soja]|nr:hypothetical protein JHK87_026491 [Glycine soja]